MVSGEIELLGLPPGAREVIRRRYPRAIGWGWIEGSHHQVRAELRRRERAGELAGVWYLQREHAGRTRIPYVRYLTVRQVNRRRWVLRGWLALMSGAFLAGLLMMAWSARYVIMSAGILVAITYLVKHLEAHWKRGCPGLHLVGSCKGH